MLTLIQFNPDERHKPRSFRLDDEGTHVIGRGHGDVQLLDSRVSRSHAELTVQNGTWVIRDLGSSNGTWVNGERIEGMCELEEGDRLVVGRVTLLVGHLDVAGGASVATPVPPSMDAPTAEAHEIEPELSSGPQAELEGSALDEAAAAELIAGEVASEPVLGDDLNLEAELDLDPIDFDFEAEDNFEVAAPSETSEAPAASTGQAVENEKLEAVESAEETPDLVRLDNELGDENPSGAEASSLAPALEQARPETPSADPVAASEADEIDEYAATMAFVTPTSRPDSPLDQAHDGPNEIDNNVPSVPEHLEDDAPEIVGLSLDLPGPVDEDLSTDAGNPSEPTEQGASDEEGLPPVLSKADTGQDEDSTTEHDQAPPVAEVVETQAEGGPDLVESEAQQELDAAWSSQSTSRWKGVAVLALFALIASAGVWVIINGMGSSPPVAGLNPGTNPGTAVTPPKELPDASAAEASPVSPQNPAVALATPPAPSVAIRSAPLDDSPTDAPSSTASDAFGAAPTLVAPAPRTVAPADPEPVVTPAPTATAEATPRDPVSASMVSDPPIPATAGPTLAMIDPTPKPDPLIDFEPSLPTVEPEPEPAPVTAAAAKPARRIAFVIDASGSMVDSMNQGALTWLESRLDTLNEDDQFTVIFFRSSEVLEAPPTGMKPGDSLTRELTLGWVAPDAGNVRPRGKSEPLSALQQAQRYQPTEIYILSDDKFGQRRAAAAIDDRDLEPLVEQSDVVVHTVQFFYDNPEDRRLETIAQRFGGTYEFVKEPPFDFDANQELGVDLLGITR